MRIRGHLVPIAITFLMISLLVIFIINPFLCKNNHSDPIWLQGMHVYEASFNENYYSFKGSVGTSSEILIISVHLEDGANMILAATEFPLLLEPGLQNLSLNFPIIGIGQQGNHLMQFVYEVDCGAELSDSTIVYFNSTI